MKFLLKNILVTSAIKDLQIEIEASRKQIANLQSRLALVEAKSWRENATPLTFADNEDSLNMYKECIERKLDKICNDTMEHDLRELIIVLVRDAAEKLKNN